MLEARLRSLVAPRGPADNNDSINNNNSKSKKKKKKKDSNDNPPAPSGPPGCAAKLRASSFKSPDVKQ